MIRGYPYFRKPPTYLENGRTWAAISQQEGILCEKYAYVRYQPILEDIFKGIKVRCWRMQQQHQHFWRCIPPFNGLSDSWHPLRCLTTCCRRWCSRWTSRSQPGWLTLLEMPTPPRGMQGLEGKPSKCPVHCQGGESWAPAIWVLIISGIYYSSPLDLWRSLGHALCSKPKKIETYFQDGMEDISPILSKFPTFPSFWGLP